MIDQYSAFEANRRRLLQGAAAGAALLTPLSALAAAADMDAIRKAANTPRRPVVPPAPVVYPPGSIEVDQIGY